jgi:hypothetical protein
MQIESETLSMLMWGFYIVTAISLGVILKLWFRNKSKAYLWFVVQFAFLYFAFNKFLYLIKPKPEISAVMLSEENSLALGIMGALWAVSTFCMIIGIWILDKENKC